MIWYGILDLLLGPLFLYYFIFALRNIDYGLFGFHSGKYTDGAYGTAGAGYGANGAGGAPGYSTKTAAAPPMAGRV